MDRSSGSKRKPETLEPKQSAERPPPKSEFRNNVVPNMNVPGVSADARKVIAGLLPFGR